MNSSLQQNELLKKEKKPSPSVSKEQRMLRIALLVVGIPTFFCFLFADPILRTIGKSDLAGVKAQSGSAVLVTLAPAGPDIFGTPQPPFAVVRFDGKLHTAGKVDDFSRLHLNSPVHIIYRVGHSGSVYVDEVAPAKP